MGEPVNKTKSPGSSASQRKIPLISEITFLDICIYKDEKEKSIFDVRKHFKSTDTFQYTQFSSCHPQERLYERQSLRLLVTNSSKTTFEENITLFKQRLRNRGFPDKRLDKTLSEVNFSERCVRPMKQRRRGISPFCA